MTSSTKRFSYLPSRNFQRACADIGAEVAFPYTNAEFEKIQEGVLGSELIANLEIFIYLRKDLSGSSEKLVDENHFS